MKLNLAALQSLSPSEREEVDLALAAFARTAEANPLVRFVPHPKQVEFLSARTKTKAFFAGNRAGKTTCGIVDALIQSVDESVLPERLRHFKRWQAPYFLRVVTPDLGGTQEGVLYPKLREWCPPGQLLGGSWSNAYNKVRRTLTFANGSRWDFMSSEMALDKFGGAALHGVLYDEEPPEPIRNECAARLIDFGGEELFCMTPLHGMTYTYSLYERRFEPGVTVVTASTDDNPHLDSEAKERFFAGLSDEERRARREGRFVHFHGLVFGEFEDSKHVVPPVAPEQLEGQQIVVGIDPGIRWCGVTFNAFDRDNALLTFDELFLTDSTVETVATGIKAKLASWGFSLKARDWRRPLFVIDPSASQRSFATGENIDSEFSRFGIYTSPANNKVEAGVFTLKRRLQSDPPAVLVTANCQRLRWD